MTSFGRVARENLLPVHHETSISSMNHLLCRPVPPLFLAICLALSVLGTQMRGADGGSPSADEQLAALTAALQAQPQNAALWHARGKMRLQLSDPVGALADCSEAIRLDPFKLDFRLSRARLLAAGAQWGEVVADATAGLALDPKQVDLLVLRANARRNLGQLGEALADADKAVSLDAASLPAYGVRAWVYLFRQDWAKAAQDAALALQQNPDDIDLLMVKGIAHRELQETAAARDCFDRISKLDSKNSGAIFNLAKLDLAKGDWTAAAAGFSKALQLAPQLPEALAGRGRARLETGDAEGAVEDFSRAIRARSEQPDLYLLRARAGEKLGDFERAVADAGKAVALGSLDPEAHLLIARYDEKQAAWDAVLRHASRVLELSPNNTEALGLKGRALLARGETGPGLEALGQAIASKPDDWHLRVERAAVLHRQQRFDEAVADCDKAIELNPQAMYAFSLRGYCHLQKGKTDEALRDCEKAITLDPQQPLPLLVRARVMLSRNDAAKAVTDCTAALKLMPDSAWGYSTLALALVQQSRPEEAVAAATKALQIAPSDAESFATRGRALVALRRYKSAARDIDHAIELDPALKTTLSADLEELKNRR
jgi:tetratricopeptide (TPR) repeat protein